MKVNISYMAAFLNSNMVGHPIYKFGIAPIEFVDLTNVGVYPKMMFLRALEAVINHKIDFVPPIYEHIQRQRAPSEKPNLNIFPECSQLRTSSMLIWPPYFTQQHKIAFVAFFHRQTIKSLD